MAPNGAKYYRLMAVLILQGLRKDFPSEWNTTADGLPVSTADQWDATSWYPLVCLLMLATYFFLGVACDLLLQQKVI